LRAGDIGPEQKKLLLPAIQTYSGKRLVFEKLWRETDHQAVVTAWTKAEARTGKAIRPAFHRRSAASAWAMKPPQIIAALLGTISMPAVATASSGPPLDGTNVARA